MPQCTAAAHIVTRSLLFVDIRRTGKGIIETNRHHGHYRYGYAAFRYASPAYEGHRRKSNGFMRSWGRPEAEALAGQSGGMPDSWNHAAYIADLSQ